MKKDYRDIKGQIYYAHSMRIYNTKREHKEIKYLNKLFGEIYDPKEEITWDSTEKMDPYFNAVKKSEIIVVSEYKDCIGKGVYDEISTALINQIPVYCIRKSFLGRCKLKLINSIYRVGNDWKIYYGKIRICGDKN